MLRGEELGGTDKIPDSFLLPLICSRSQPFVKAEEWNRDKEGLTERQKKKLLLLHVAGL